MIEDIIHVWYSCVLQGQPNKATVCRASNSPLSEQFRTLIRHSSLESTK